MPPALTAQLERELALIARLGFCGYFLIVWDICRHAREQGILVQGRGSAANSAACHALDEDDLFQVLGKSESSLIHQYERSFGAYGIKLRFEPDALRKLAALARNAETGARGLMTVLERTFRDLKFRLPSTRIRSLTITAQTVENPAVALAKLLKK